MQQGDDHFVHSVQQREGHRHHTLLQGRLDSGEEGEGRFRERGTGETALAAETEEMHTGGEVGGSAYCQEGVQEGSLGVEGVTVDELPEGEELLRGEFVDMSLEVLSEERVHEEGLAGMV